MSRVCKSQSLIGGCPSESRSGLSRWVRWKPPQYWSLTQLYLCFLFQRWRQGGVFLATKQSLAKICPPGYFFYKSKRKAISSVARPGNRPAAWQATPVAAHAVEAVPDAVRNVECPVFSMRHFLLVAKNCLCDDSSWGADSGQPLFPEIIVN